MDTHAHNKRGPSTLGIDHLEGPHIDHQAFEALSCTAQLLRLVLDEDGAIRSYQMLPATVTDAPKPPNPQSDNPTTRQPGLPWN